MCMRMVMGTIVMVIMSMFMRMFGCGIGIGPQPVLDIERFAGRIIKTRVEQPAGLSLAAYGIEKERGRIERVETLAQSLESLGIAGEISLGQNQAIGDSHLFDCLSMGVERRIAIDGIDGRDHAIQPKAQHQIGMIHDRMQDGSWISEASRLDHDSLKRLDAIIIAPAQQIFQRTDEIAADRAA